MSHNVESMAYANETPWHGLGKSVQSNLKPEEMLVEAGLDWKVESVPLMANYKGDMIPSGKSALIRSSDSTCLDVVSTEWKTLQNHEAFSFFSEFVEAGSMTMETAGSLDEGRIVWGLAKVDKSFSLFDKDRIDSYLLFTNPHKYGKTINIKFTPIRVVCQNTLTLSTQVGSKNSFSVNHRRNFNMAEVKATMDLNSNMMEKYSVRANLLSSKKASKEQIKEYINNLFPYAGTNTNREYSLPGSIVANNMDSQPGVEFGEGSWWQAFNGVTYAVDHKFGHKQDTRLRSAWYGAGAAKKEQALKLALEMAK